MSYIKKINELKDEMKYILSYGGGVNSSALFFYILEKKMPLGLVIFSDTGVESKETYNAIRRLKNLCLLKNIEFVSVSSKYGNLYDYYYDHKAVMSLKFRDCTGKFKISPIRQYIRGVYGKHQKFTMYIGIASDEWQRVRDSDVKYIINSYPFVDDKIDRDGNINILKKHNFPATKSGCVGCMFNKKANWIKMLKEEPEEFEKWNKLEMNNSRYPEILLNQGYPLEKLKKAIKEQTSLNTFFDEDITCDAVNGGCF